jgi:hypothetical protein
VLSLDFRGGFAVDQARGRIVAHGPEAMGCWLCSHGFGRPYPRNANRDYSAADM